MELWEKLLWALLIGTMVAFVFPRVRQTAKNAPKGTSSDWVAAVVPLLLVAGFVVLLTLLV